MIYTLESHCHSCYSLDCGTRIELIVAECKKKGIDAVILCDHDTCGITDADIEIFRREGVIVLQSIEFTTSEGVHIIGVGEGIKDLQRSPRHYSCRQLISVLFEIGVWIIIPHPDHATGLIGNFEMCEADVDFALRASHFLELGNYKYGVTSNVDILLSEYPNLRGLVGSDAHSSASIGAFTNTIITQSVPTDVLASFYHFPITNHRSKKHSKMYLLFKRIKKTGLYQRVLNCFDPGLRMKIKNKLFNR